METTDFVVSAQSNDYADYTDEKSEKKGHGGRRNTEKNSQGYDSRPDAKEFRSFGFPSKKRG